MGRMEKNAPKLKPQFVDKDGVRTHAVIPYDQYLALIDYLEDVEDMTAMKIAVEEDAREPRIPWQQLKKELKL